MIEEAQANQGRLNAKVEGKEDKQKEMTGGYSRILFLSMSSAKGRFSRIVGGA